MPDEFAALDTAIAAALAAAQGADDWDAGTRRAVIERMQRLSDALAAVNLRVVGAEQRAGTWGLRGDRDMSTFLGRVTHQGRGGGLALAGQAATLARMPAVAEAMVDGPVTARHLQEITRATGASPSLAAELTTPDGQERLVRLATTFDGSRFATALKRMSAALDPATRQRQHDEQRAERFFFVTHTPGGTRIKGMLDEVAGHELTKALAACNPRPALDDHRTSPQRLADALSAMVRQVLTDVTTTPKAVAPVQALVTLSERTWLALRGTRPDEGAKHRDAAPGSATAVIRSLRDVDPVVDEDGRSWPASEIARALCDCLLTRAVVDGEGRALDLGRGERLFQRANWLALYASGQHTCAVAGCEMPLRYTELHHMRWWGRDNGRTDQANCAPECAFHHQESHRLDLQVTRLPDGSYEHHYPDGRIYGGVPPGVSPARERDAATAGIAAEPS